MPYRALLVVTVIITYMFPTFSGATDKPTTYTVKEGDTLWTIAEQYFAEPWYWSDIWAKNSHIDDPDKIYPGDTLQIITVDGQTKLMLAERGIPNGYKKLSPHIRSTPIQQAIPTIPMDAIEQFLAHASLASANQMQNAPYIAAISDQRVIAGTGERIYVRGFKDEDLNRQGYGIFREGKPYLDPDDETQTPLGYEVIHLGEANLQKSGDPATLVVTNALQEILVKDRILPKPSPIISERLTPKAPDGEVKGKIISVYGGVSQIGQYDVVVINRGQTHQVAVGDVLGVFQHGGQGIDPTSDSLYDSEKSFTIPDERAGVMMVFKTFDNLSMALVLKAKKALHLGDVAANLEQF